jgi:hypothetical protein
MLVIQNIDNIKYKRIRHYGTNTTWQISNVNDYPGLGEYWFHITDGNTSRKIILHRNERIIEYDNKLYSVTLNRLKTMHEFIRALHKIIND